MPYPAQFGCSGQFSPSQQVMTSTLIIEIQLYNGFCLCRLSRSDGLMARNGTPVPIQPTPNSAAYRKTFMTRRHSSGTSDTPIVRDKPPPHAKPIKSTSAFGSYALVAEERRWSLADAECRRASGLFVSVAHFTSFITTGCWTIVSKI